MPQPSECQDMSSLRAEIDKIDAALIGLLARRCAYIDRAVDIKRRERQPARVEWRVNEVLSHVQSLARAEHMDPQLASDLWNLLIEWSIAHEEQQLS